jgi:hypothetical protein
MSEISTATLSRYVVRSLLPSKNKKANKLGEHWAKAPVLALVGRIRGGWRGEVSPASGATRDDEVALGKAENAQGAQPFG